MHTPFCETQQLLGNHFDAKKGNALFGYCECFCPAASPERVLN